MRRGSNKTRFEFCLNSHGEIQCMLALSQNIRFAFSFLFFKVSLQFLAMTCKFCNAWRPKQSNFYNALFKLHFAWQYVLQQCFFCMSLFFLHCAQKIRRPGGGLCHFNISIVIFALLRICEISVHFFTLLRQTVFCSVEIAMLWLLCGCILEQCKFYTAL